MWVIEHATGLIDGFLAMVSKLTGILKDGNAGDRVAARIEDYERRYGGAARGGLDERKADYRKFENTYYDLVTDFYEYGWGQSFHFAPLMKASPRRSLATNTTLPTGWPWGPA